ncbi:hypothetical protein CVT24_007245 [Panaeolus cyanescens]|uniref:Uncharacterized protein n=1 Tax=Panaeolus cyanescens TaxID=181874 RepID=A0A409YPC7_9AGAR|nr:hypothetical protein CVT24_007245 [Panaeolus cyanescens]
MSYVNPLHAPIQNNAKSGFSSLAGAFPASAGGAPVSDKRRRLAQTIYYPSAKWQNATKRSPASAPITFDYRGRKGYGVSMTDLSARSIPNIMSLVENADEKVLVSSGHTKITFRIMWPGYDSGSEWVRSIDVRAPEGPFTRAQLGQAVAQNFSRYVEKHRNQPCSVPDSRIADNNIRFEHLVLVSLHNTFDDSWQAEVVIDFK